MLGEELVTEGIEDLECSLAADDEFTIAIESEALVGAVTFGEHQAET